MNGLLVGNTTAPKGVYYALIIGIVSIFLLIFGLRRIRGSSKKESDS